MCGICGEVRFDGRPACTDGALRMMDAMACRGPDGQGVVARGRVVLGHRRLKIIDLSERAAQPMVDSVPQIMAKVVKNTLVRCTFRSFRKSLINIQIGIAFSLFIICQA